MKIMMIRKNRSMKSLAGLLHGLVLLSCWLLPVTTVPAAERAGLPSIGVEGTVLRVRTAEGRVVEGEGLAGATLTIVFNAAPVRARIVSVVPDPDTPEGDILLYDLQVIGESGHGRPLCNPDAKGRRAGFPMAGHTDETGALQQADSFEFVCTSGAQGKCALFGYAPWRRSADGKPMLDHFNACVRMVRADYCGNGRSMTRDGTLIGFGDRIGINSIGPPGSKDGLPSTFAFEASWAPGGATCVARPRLPDLITLDGLAAACPRLAGRLGIQACRGLEADGLIDNYSRQKM
jgi:hypothetical protein